MNQQIRELIQAADSKCSETRGVYDEILIKLVVRKCMQLVGDGTQRGEIYHNRIQQYFGINQDLNP